MNRCNCFWMPQNTRFVICEWPVLYAQLSRVRFAFIWFIYLSINEVFPAAAKLSPRSFVEEASYKVFVFREWLNTEGKIIFQRVLKPHTPPRPLRATSRPAPITATDIYSPRPSSPVAPNWSLYMVRSSLVWRNVAVRACSTPQLDVGQENPEKNAPDSICRC